MYVQTGETLRSVVYIGVEGIVLMKEISAGQYIFTSGGQL